MHRIVAADATAAPRVDDERSNLLDELTLGRDLRRRRDMTMRRARRVGATVGQVAVATGLSVTHVERIWRTAE